VRIVLIVPYSKYYIHFSWNLVEILAAGGNEVIAMAPDDEFRGELESIGVRFIQVPLNNTGMNPFYDVYGLYKLTAILQAVRPDRVLCYSIKPVLYGTMASRLARIKHVSSFITGLGYVFIGTTAKHRILLGLIKQMYKLALKRCDEVFFENPDDLELFRSLHLLKDNQTAYVVQGSGVDLDKFAFTPPRTDPLTFLMISRIIRDKGIHEFVEAARIIKAGYPRVRFRILGPFDHNPSAIGQEVMREWVNQGLIEYPGETRDVRPFIAESSVFVLPSYREGTPKSTLEAMAMGRPVITTDVPGCRETVRHNGNGFLVAAQDSAALAAAMEIFILNPALIPAMGLKSREIAAAKYDVRKVNDYIKQKIGLP